MPCSTCATPARAAAFYQEALDFEVVAEVGDGAGVFLEAAGTENHHDLGLFSLGPTRAAAGTRPRRPLPPRLAGRLDPRPRRRCATGSAELGALVGASDHGVSKSLYAHGSRRQRVRGDVGRAPPRLGRRRRATTRSSPARPRRRARPLRLTAPQSRCQGRTAAGSRARTVRRPGGSVRATRAS